MTAATADVIIIGAGVVGCSTAFHLAALGLKPLVLEWKGIAQAATSYAAGLLTRARSKPCLMPLVRQTYLDVQRLVEVTGDSLGLRTTGSLYLGSSQAAKEAHRALMALALAQGEIVRQLSPGEAMGRLPWLRLEGEEEVYEMPEDAFIDGYTLASSYAQAARQKGAKFIEEQGVLAMIAHYVSDYSTYTPDGMLAVGPLPGLAGFFSGSGCSGGGVAMCGGIGKALARMIRGVPLEFDMRPHDPGRFGTLDPFSFEWRQRCANARSRKTSG